MQLLINFAYSFHYLQSMNHPRQISISQIAQHFESDDITTKKYISDNLLVAREVNASTFKHMFLHEPIILPEMRILIIKEGNASPTINLVEQHFTPHDMIFVGNNSMVEIHEDYELIGYGLSMSDELFKLALGNNIPKTFDGHLRNFKIHLEDEEWEQINALHLTLYNSLKAQYAPLSTLHLIAAFLWQAHHLFSRQEQYSLQRQTREQRLVSNFISLVNEFSPRHHTIDFYASKLCLSTRYMSSTIKRLTGKAAKQWIDDALLTRIKIELSYSSKPINIIADEMNFPSASFFTKYFKRLTGLTPSQYQARRQ